LITVVQKNEHTISQKNSTKNIYSN